jgi:hypothetical protein
MTGSATLNTGTWADVLRRIEPAHRRFPKLVDIEMEGFQDARLTGRSAMTAEQTREWIAAGFYLSRVVS